MTQSRIGAVALLMATLAIGAPSADAQTVATSFEDLQALVQPGDSVDVVDTQGHRVRGQLRTLTASSLELVSDRRFSESDVTRVRVQRRDPVWKGTLIGAAVVGGPWLLLCNPAT